MQTIKQLLKTGVGAIIIGLTMTYVFAWTGPTGDPPTSNIAPPITVNNVDQAKVGGLTIGGIFQADDWAIFNSNVGIGTTNPNNLLQVSGLINFPNDRAGTFLGFKAGNANTGYYNSFIGNQAGLNNTIGNSNTALGNYALFSNTAGNNNSAIGMGAGKYQADGTTPLQTANNSIYIGSDSKGFNNSDDNSIVIGANTIGIGANSVVLGNDSITKTALWGNVGINTTNPEGALDVFSTTGAFIVPRMTTVQRDALTAVDGMIIYNTTTNQFNFRENGAWVLK